jgi:hypothetical protein
MLTICITSYGFALVCAAPDGIDLFIVWGLFEQASIRLRALGGVSSQVEILRVGADEACRLAGDVLPVARPIKIGRVQGQACAYRIHFDVPHACQEIARCFDEAGLESALIERAGPAVQLVDVAYISPPQVLHHSRRSVLRAGRCEDVDVIRHQDECMNIAGSLGSRLPKTLEEMEPIGIREENGLAVVAAHDEMLRQAGEIDSRSSGHSTQTGGQGARRTKKNGSPQGEPSMICPLFREKRALTLRT